MTESHAPPSLPLTGRRILLGVTASIAAYKAAELARLLGRAGAEVRVVMTPGATAFVGPMTFHALTGHPVRSALFDADAEAAMGHIELARWADLVLVAPATADAIARAAQGRADDLLSTLLLATPAPRWFAPAMNAHMWAAPATRRNVDQLRADGAVIVGPAAGEQACGDVGEGRLLEPEAIVAELTHALGVVGGVLSGRRVLVTAGPTVEPLDPVRFLSNRSSGRMGFAVAAAARAAGAAVTLVHGPVHRPVPAGVAAVPVGSASQMYDAVMATLDREAFGPDDVVIGAAAVADYAPEPAPEKLKKSKESLSLTLTPTRDIIAAVAARSPKPFTVGFAAETRDLETYARSKLERKKLDLVAANVVGEGLAFDQTDNELVVLAADARIELGRADKALLAERLVALIATRLGAHALTRG